MHGVGAETRLEKRSTFAYVFLSCIVGIVFWIALAASVDMNYGVAQFTFADATLKACHMPIASIFRDNYARGSLWFLVSVGLAVATVFMPRPSFRIVTVVIALLVLWVLLPKSWGAPILAPVFPMYLITGTDGETWGEAWPAMSAIGFWEVVSIGYVVVQWVCGRRRIKNATV
jgi:hypothetical protein